MTQPKKCSHIEDVVFETDEPKKDRVYLGKWLVEHMPRGTYLELPDRDETDRPNAFLEETDL